MTDETITRWSNGRFETVTTPDWWEGEMQRLFPPDDQQQQPDEGFGDRLGANVDVWLLPLGRGFLVYLCDALMGHYLWAATEADYLDLITSRVPVFINLGDDRTIATSLAEIRNVLISWARHGAGEHITLIDGQSNIDLRRAREHQRKAPAARDERAAP